MDPNALGRSLPLWSVLPFAGFLAAIALVPLVAPAFWARHFGKVSLAFGLPVAGWFLVRAPHHLLHAAAEYASFIVLLASLFTVSGGVVLRGTIRGTPAVNCAFLGIGAVAANLFGTTGASMLLIRPLLRANSRRRRSAHVVVFFIFVVANVGGLLTPIGDPPLFLGYLKGVPFFWTVRALWLHWLVACATLIALFFAVDTAVARGERAEAGVAGAPPGEREPLALEGGWNFPLLAAVLGAVFLPTPWREAVMAAAAIASAKATPTRVREANEFTWRPIEEVAILFAGIFATMIPALLILKTRGGGLGVAGPAAFFWAAGSLSGVLDNAPTYLAFFSLAQGIGGPDQVAGVSAPILRAISAGAVFMGAITYIGNAPNFMVKAIADSAGVRMPSFLGYLAWSAAVLVPLFALITLLFFRG